MSERYDPFGRPIEGDHPWAKPAEEGDAAPLPGGFLPPESPPSVESGPSSTEATPAVPEAPERPAGQAQWPSTPPATWPSTGTPPAADTIRGAPPVESLATWGSRLGAYLVDVFIEAVLGLAAGVVVAAAGGNSTAVAIVIFAGTTLLALLYPTVMLVKTNGQTVGKKLVGVRVVRAHGEPIAWRTAVMREIVMRGLVIGLIGTLTFGVAGILDGLWPLWDKQNQALHDHGAETWVVRDR